MSDSNTPYISVYSHRHGLSVAVITGNAQEYWAKTDGYVEGESDDDYFDSIELDPLYRAAPDLLEALRIAKAELIDQYEENYPNGESDNDITEAIDTAFAAIAKAEGRTA